MRLENLEHRALPSVLTPAQVRHAYGFDQVSFASTGQTIAGDGSGQTIAIVDAYDDPNIASDLRAFDARFGLANPVFTKASPTGVLPRVDAGWSEEIALDVEWAHAIAPKAKILLVEAASSSLNDLMVAVDYARHQAGVSTVSMSWGGSEFPAETLYDNIFATPAGHTPITFVASSGDSGAWYGPEWPAVSPRVLSVGGTSLQVSAAGAYAGETGWYGTGGGFSNFEVEPAYQYSAQNSGVRTTPDVAYDADPSTGVYVYDSVNGGWFQVGGTSMGAPEWAALVAIANQGRALTGQPALYSSSQTVTALYDLAKTSYTTYFHDITTGFNGYFAGAGYDLVTGLGSPRANALIGALVQVTGLGPALTFRATSSAATGTTTTVGGATRNALESPASAPPSAAASIPPSEQRVLVTAASPRGTVTPITAPLVEPIAASANSGELLANLSNSSAVPANHAASNDAPRVQPASLMAVFPVFGDGAAGDSQASTGSDEMDAGSSGVDDSSAPAKIVPDLGIEESHCPDASDDYFVESSRLSTRQEPASVADGSKHAANYLAAAVDMVMLSECLDRRSNHGQEQAHSPKGKRIRRRRLDQR